MSSGIQQREIDGIEILDLNEKLELGPSASALQDCLAELLQSDKTRVIINLQRVPAIDSTGLGVLVSAYSDFEKAQGAIKLLSLSEGAMELLVLTKLTTTFAIFDDERTAIDSFFPDRAPRHFDILEFVKSQEGQTQHVGASSSESSREGEDSPPMDGEKKP